MSQSRREFLNAATAISAGLALSAAVALGYHPTARNRGPGRLAHPQENSITSEKRPIRHHVLHASSAQSTAQVSVIAAPQAQASLNASASISFRSAAANWSHRDWQKGNLRNPKWFRSDSEADRRQAACTAAPRTWHTRAICSNASMVSRGPLAILSNRRLSWQALVASSTSPCCNATREKPIR
jgi:hypothetical protein